MHNEGKIYAHSFSKSLLRKKKCRSNKTLVSKGERKKKDPLMIYIDKANIKQNCSAYLATL